MGGSGCTDVVAAADEVLRLCCGWCGCSTLPLFERFAPSEDDNGGWSDIGCKIVVASGGTVMDCNADNCERLLLDGDGICTGIVVEEEVEVGGRPISAAPALTIGRGRGDGSGYCAFQFKNSPSFHPVPIGPRFDDDAPFLPVFDLPFFFFIICLPVTGGGGGGAADADSEEDNSR